MKYLILLLALVLSSCATTYYSLDDPLYEEQIVYVVEEAPQPQVTYQYYNYDTPYSSGNYWGGCNHFYHSYYYNSYCPYYTGFTNPYWNYGFYGCNDIYGNGYYSQNGMYCSYGYYGYGYNGYYGNHYHRHNFWCGHNGNNHGYGNGYYGDGYVSNHYYGHRTGMGLHYRTTRSNIILNDDRVKAPTKPERVVREVITERRVKKPTYERIYEKPVKNPVPEVRYRKPIPGRRYQKPVPQRNYQKPAPPQQPRRKHHILPTPTRKVPPAIKQNRTQSNKRKKK